MKLIAQVKLQTTPEQSNALQRTMLAYNDAANYISGEAWMRKTFRAYDLHHATYYAVRERFGLSARQERGRGDRLLLLPCAAARTLARPTRKTGAERRKTGQGFEYPCPVRLNASAPPSVVLEAYYAPPLNHSPSAERLRCTPAP